MSGYTAGDIAEWCGSEWDPVPPGRVVGVSKDTRTIERDEIYFALRGQNFDGHDFVKVALGNGACGAVVSAGWVMSAGRSEDYAGKSLLAVRDTGEALTACASGYRRRMKVMTVAVTGSAGKTTVKEMVMAVLRKAGKTGGTRGNYNNGVGVPLSVLGMDGDEDYAVFELGTSRRGEIGHLAGVVEPRWGIITNVAQAHVEYFGSVEDIAVEKASLLVRLPDDGVAFLNADCERFDQVRGMAHGTVVTVSGDGKDADYACVARQSVGNEFVVREKTTGETQRMRLSVPGRHNVANALFAVAVGRRAGLGWGEIGKALESVRQLSMRWEETVAGGIRVINDAYNANPASVRAAVETFLERPCYGTKWLVLSGMLELGDREGDEHRAVGRYVAGRFGGIKSVRLVAVGRLGELVAEGAIEGGMDAGKILKCAGNADVSRVLAEGAGDKDEVLLKGSRGTKLEEVLKNIVEYFSGTDKAM